MKNKSCCCRLSNASSPSYPSTLFFLIPLLPPSSPLSISPSLFFLVVPKLCCIFTLEKERKRTRCKSEPIGSARCQLIKRSCNLVYIVGSFLYFSIARIIARMDNLSSNEHLIEVLDSVARSGKTPTSSRYICSRNHSRGD